MRIAIASLMCLLLQAGAWGQTLSGPTDLKAQKTFAQAQKELKALQYGNALYYFKKADKQDGGKCAACQEQIAKLGVDTGDLKAAEAAAQAMLAEAKDPIATAFAHYTYGSTMLREGLLKKNKSDFFAGADREFKLALAAHQNFPAAVFSDGIALANLNQDNAAKAQFEHYLAITTVNDARRKRAKHYDGRPELARARLAPIFSVKTLDGQELTLDDLTGKVVLIDFWATWCGPCREALPHLKELVSKFKDQPLVVLSVSLDSDEAKWKDFIAKNDMTWLQYRDGGFQGPISQQFAVEAIPSTFTIDADGVLEDQHAGDASIEGKLKKLCAQARQEEEVPKEEVPKTGQ